MFDPMTGKPSGAHTSNPVPFHLIDEEARGIGLRTGGALEDVAPTMLGILGIDKPFEMTGLDLRVA
jgi:2,3-bisphosphoglycerate-independent phosphoglycerate mutase